MLSDNSIVFASDEITTECCRTGCDELAVNAADPCNTPCIHSYANEYLVGIGWIDPIFQKRRKEMLAELAEMLPGNASTMVSRDQLPA